MTAEQHQTARAELARLTTEREEATAELGAAQRRLGRINAQIALMEAIIRDDDPLCPRTKDVLTSYLAIINPGAPVTAEALVEHGMAIGWVTGSAKPLDTMRSRMNKWGADGLLVKEGRGKYRKPWDQARTRVDTS